jgi:hypothetical protein
MSAEPISTDFDTWATTDIAGHIDRLLDRLPPQPPPEGPARRRPPHVSAELGDTDRGDLCWVCYSGPIRTGPTLPRLRACTHCLAYDRHQARLLGFRMLMPLMDWHTQPVEPGRTPPTDPTFRGWLADLWCEVERLQEWRIDGVRAGFTILDLPRDGWVHTWDWMHTMRWGPERSRACWEAYLSGLHPRLFSVVQRVAQRTRQRKVPHA